MNSAYNAEMHVVGKSNGTPCSCGGSDESDSSDRKGVVHVTSNGTETGDYALGMVNVGRRLSDPFTLAEATADQAVSFDYYEGSQNTGAAPDEVYVIVETAGKTIDELANKLYGDDFLKLEPEQQLKVDEKYRAQFDADYQSLDEISQDAFGHSYLELSGQTLGSSITARVYVNQFDDSKLSKDELAQIRWDQSYDTLSSTHQSQVDSLYAAQTVEGSSDDNAGTQRYLAVTHVDDNGDANSSSDSSENGDKEFNTFNVSNALQGGQTNWMAVPVSSENLMSTDAIEEIAFQLRDERETFSNFVDQYGEDAELVGVGFGLGYTTRQSVLDMYYDDLMVKYSADGNSKTATFDFPATVPANVKASDRLNTKKSGAFTVTAELQQDEAGLDLEDVIKKSVRIAPFQSVAPPVDVGIPARKVTVEDGKLTAKFPASKIPDLLGTGEDCKFVLAGEFDVESASSFYGVGTVDVFTPGGGDSDDNSTDDSDGNSTSESDFVEWTTQVLGNLS
ncbi:hypothetical protein [Halopelagius longus]|nr:hypothetical protein [Halopelagius longus]RDI69692.1 hypothetical protein DWB78_18145 [Halopelagius longus]